MSETPHSKRWPFTRMNGLGNAFIVIDARERELSLSGDAVRALADKDNPQTKGCDQLLIIHPPRQTGDVFMQIFNADGGEVEACGNGARAVAAFMARLDRQAVTLETLGGTLTCQTALKGTLAQVTIQMPLPQFGARLSLSADMPDALPVNMGNPHAVMFIDASAPQTTAALAAEKGPMLEHHEAFAQGANINFAQLIEPQFLRLDTWERGAGLTLACGTGACASAAAAIHQGLSDAGTVRISPPFNKNDNETDVLIIDYQPDAHLTMSGPAEFEFDAELCL